MNIQQNFKGKYFIGPASKNNSLIDRKLNVTTGRTNDLYAILEDVNNSEGQKDYFVKNVGKALEPIIRNNKNVILPPDKIQVHQGDTVEISHC